MSLILRKTSQWWYGYFRIDGEETVVQLGVKVEGQRPASLKNDGDSLFENSRGRAQAEHDRVKKELTDKRNLTKLTERLIAVKTGDDDSLKTILLSDMANCWSKTRERRKKDSKYAGEVKAILNRFVNFMQERYPKVKEMLLVRAEMTKAFMDAEEERGVSSTTWNYTLKQLKSAFFHLERHSPAYRDHLEMAELKEQETIHHQPFTPEQLKAILEASTDDDFIHPIIVTGICTAMRRSDCCRLRWESVDLGKDICMVKTNKTSSMVAIPILPLLREVLIKCKRGESEFVFPEQAAMVEQNPDDITNRVQRVFEKAGFKDIVDEDKVEVNGGSENGQKAEGKPSKSNIGKHAGGLTIERKVGLRRATIRGFHSFRTTWITIALSNNVSMPVVQMVTGHETVEIVIKHYFRPGAEQFRAMIFRAMPDLLVGKGNSKREGMLEILQNMKSSTWRSDRARLVKMLEAHEGVQNPASGI